MVHPPSGGSREKRVRTTSEREKTPTCLGKRHRTHLLPVRGIEHEHSFRDQGRQEGKALAGAEQRLLPARRCTDSRRIGGCLEGADLHGNQRPTQYQQILGGRLASL